MAQSGRRDAPELPDFSLLKRLARDQLIYLLEQVTSITSLNPQHEVDKLYKVELKPIVSTADQLCFLIRPRIQTVKWISVNLDKAAGRLRRYKIIFTPQKFYACEAVLEEQGVFGDVTCDEWAFYLLPLDDDIISLELPEFFRENFLEGDQRWVGAAGGALRLIHSLYGPFSKVYGIGQCAKMVYESWREQVEDGEQKTQQPEIGNVFLIDRDVDFITPLCSQVVYEGLVDDIFRIKCGSVEFGPEVTSSDKSIKVMLNSQDKVFNEIRNEHFSNVFGFLSQKARNLQTAYDKRRGMDIQQMKAFVSEELKGLKQEHRLLSLRELQRYRVAALQSYRATTLQGYSVTELQSYNVTELQRYRVTELQRYRVTALQSYSITELQHYRVTGFTLKRTRKLNKHVCGHLLN
uniref:VPS33B late endosome and lysosome associated n=1 Tax=Astyanax mexicanus TaxID=7994 RepID=A0A8B9JNH0_ASTMX